MRYENGEKKPNMIEMMTNLKNSTDFLQMVIHGKDIRFWLSYYRTMVDPAVLEKLILTPLSHKEWSSLEDISKIVPIEDIVITIDTDMIKQKALGGYIIIALTEYGSPAAVIKAPVSNNRSVTLPEVEFSVIGPKESFVEALDTNINLIRKRLATSELQVIETQVGNLSSTKIAVMYIEGIADPDNVQTVWQRLNDIDFDLINDSSMITQLISDNKYSPFPQLLDTERPDRIAAALAEGKVSIAVNGSPQVLIGPTTFVEFFAAFDDYYYNWIVASFFRIVRLFSVTFSILITPVYVAVLNYHYELVPRDLLNTVITSRRDVPFPPILEAIFLELTIELLREAGARLPTKVGQTIGIVGGIVIGTASVEAGLTSNILLIVVALTALASFTTPVYNMGNTIRILRFPLLLLANQYGLLGIVYGLSFLMVHLLKLTSLGRPYLEPIFPMRPNDIKDAIFRAPFSKMYKRPVFLRPQRIGKFNIANVKKKNDGNQK
ncbi:spore germination protein [Bacillus gobiensis]